MKFQWDNSRLSWSFKVLYRLLVSLLVLSKDDCKILVSFKQVSHFWMVKVKKVNIAVTYQRVAPKTAAHSAPSVAKTVIGEIEKVGDLDLNKSCCIRIHSRDLDLDKSHIN
jgi:hypothetical protein